MDEDARTILKKGEAERAFFERRVKHQLATESSGASTRVIEVRPQNDGRLVNGNTQPWLASRRLHIRRRRAHFAEKKVRKQANPG